MKRFAATASIRARPETIWALLTDAAGYPHGIRPSSESDGHIAADGKITVHAKSAPGRAFPLRVTEFVPMRRMTWAGGMPLGLFTGTRNFVLTPTASGDVTFTMDETYRGPLAPLITRSIPDLQPAFDTFAADLKRRAEAQQVRAGA